MAESKIAVVAALVGNLAVAITKFTAAAFTGSSAMFAEGIHSMVDTGNAGLLLFGMRRSRKPADENHPFGHGHELYFWAFLVAVMIFGVGGGISVYEGILHILEPSPLEDPTWNYVVLGLAAVFEGISLIIAVREFQKEKGPLPFFRAVRASKDPTVFMVVFEDSAAFAGLVFAFLGVYLSHLFDAPYLDGAASILIGLVLAGVALFLAFETRGLLVGESANPEMRRSIQALAEADSGVEHVNPPLTMYLGPHTVIVALEIQFHGALSAAEVAASVDRIEKAIRHEHPDVKHIFIEADAVAQAQRAQ